MWKVCVDKRRENGNWIFIKLSFIPLLLNVNKDRKIKKIIYSIFFSYSLWWWRWCLHSYVCILEIHHHFIQVGWNLCTPACACGEREYQKSQVNYLGDIHLMNEILILFMTFSLLPLRCACNHVSVLFSMEPRIKFYCFYAQPLW